MESKETSATEGRRTKARHSKESNSPTQRNTRSRTSSCASTPSSSCSSSSSTFDDHRRRHRSGHENSYKYFTKRDAGASKNARADNSGSCMPKYFGSQAKCLKGLGNETVGVQKSFIKWPSSNSDSDSSNQQICKKGSRGRPKGTKGNKSTSFQDPENTVSSFDRYSNINIRSGERSSRRDSKEFKEGSSSWSRSGKPQAIVHYDIQADKFLPNEHSPHKVRLLESRFERPCTRNYDKSKSEQRKLEDTETWQGGVNNDLAFQIRDRREDLLNEHDLGKSQYSTSNTPSTSACEVSSLKANRVNYPKKKSSPVTENDSFLNRRKRLRSELSKGGLWSGLPVMLRYQKHCKPNKLISVNLAKIGVGTDEHEISGAVSSEMDYSEVEEKTTLRKKRKTRIIEESEISSGFMPSCSAETQPFPSQPNSNRAQKGQLCISERFLVATGCDARLSNTKMSKSSGSGKEKDDNIFQETQNLKYKIYRSNRQHCVARSPSESVNQADSTMNNVENESEIEGEVSHLQKVNETSRYVLNTKDHVHFKIVSKSPGCQNLNEANNQNISCPMKITVPVPKGQSSQSSNKVKQQDFTTNSKNLKNLMYDLFGSESSDTSPVSKTPSRSSKSGFSVEEACMPSMSGLPLQEILKSEKEESLSLLKTYSTGSIRHFHKIFPSSEQDNETIYEHTNDCILSVGAVENQDSQSFKNQELCPNEKMVVEPSSPSTCQTCAHDCNCKIIDTTSSSSSETQSKSKEILDTFKSPDSECEAQSSSCNTETDIIIRPDQQQPGGLGNRNAADTPQELSDASWTLGSLSVDSETTISNKVSAQFSSCSEISSSSPRRKVSFHPDSCGIDTSQHRSMPMVSRSTGRTLDGCSTQSYLPESVYSPCQQSVSSVAASSPPDVSSDYPNNTADTTQFGAVASRRNINDISKTSLPCSTCHSDESQGAISFRTKPTSRGQVRPNTYVFDVSHTNDCSTLSCIPESVYSLRDRTLSPIETMSSLPYVSNEFPLTNFSSTGSSTSTWDAENPNISNVSIRSTNDSCDSCITETSMITVPSLNESRGVLSNFMDKQVSGSLKKTESYVSNSCDHPQKTDNLLTFNPQGKVDYACAMQAADTSFLDTLHPAYVESNDNEFMNSLPSSIQNMFSKDLETKSENFKNNCKSEDSSSNNGQASQLGPQTSTCNSSVLVCHERENKASFTSTNESNESDHSSTVNYLGKRPENPRSRIVKGDSLPSVKNDSTTSVSSVDSNLKPTCLRKDLSPYNSQVLINQRLSCNQQHIHLQKDTVSQPKRSTRLLNKFGTGTQDQMPSIPSSIFPQSSPLTDLPERREKCRHKLKQTQREDFDIGRKRQVEIVRKNEEISKSSQRHLSYQLEKDSALYSDNTTESSETDSNSIKRHILKYKYKQQKKKYDANRQKVRLKIKSRGQKFSCSSNNFIDRENDADNKHTKRQKMFNFENIKEEPIELKSNDRNSSSDTSGAELGANVKGGNSNQKKKTSQKSTKGNNSIHSETDVQTTPYSSRTSRTSKFGRVTVKVGSPDSIMTNSRLVEHAKTLWLSENRRKIDLLHDSLVDEDFDDLVEDEWTRLSPKLQIRYYTRAQNALLDEDKHSVRRKRRKTERQPEKDEQEESIEVLRRYHTTRFISDVDRFMRLKPNRQRDHLKKWLLFYRKLMSRNDYSRFLYEYEQSLNKSRSANMNDSNKPGNIDIEILHRKILFECIKKFKPKAMSACTGRFQWKMMELRYLYDKEIWKMITRNSEENYVAGCRSVRLSRVMNELLDLECNGRLDVIGRPMGTNSYTNILSDLETPSLPHNLAQQCTDIFASVPPIVNIDLAQRILETQTELPVLDLSSLNDFCSDDHLLSTVHPTGDVLDNNLSRETSKIIEANVRAMMHLDADNAFFRFRESSTRSCCDLDSPSCILSTWLAADSRPSERQSTS